MRSNRDYSAIDLGNISEDFIPRTSYQIAKKYDEYIRAYPKWSHAPSSSRFRLAWRWMTNSANVRGLHAALISPGPCHIHGVFSLTTSRPDDLAAAAGFWSSIVSDFFIKTSGVSGLNANVVGRLPHVRNHPLESQLLLRTLRLNCLVLPYAPLWEELYDPSWQHDAWTPLAGIDYAGRVPLGQVSQEWEWATPLRRSADRRQALVEIDAIVAIMLGITADELITVYRTQFPVLQKYEREALYDATGRQLPTKLASEYRKKGSLKRADLTIDRITYQQPFAGVDRERDMELAHNHFAGRIS